MTRDTSAPQPPNSAQAVAMILKRVGWQIWGRRHSNPPADTPFSPPRYTATQLHSCLATQLNSCAMWGRLMAAFVQEALDLPEPPAPSPAETRAASGQHSPPGVLRGRQVGGGGVKRAPRECRVEEWLESAGGCREGADEVPRRGRTSKFVRAAGLLIPLEVRDSRVLVLPGVAWSPVAMACCTHNCINTHPPVDPVRVRVVELLGQVVCSLVDVSLCPPPGDSNPK
ncbi:hypothetical protein VOLCADRAFT_91514 [Volvox carteri f. nagariensis]|uniref:Uncharacterized protein n=1 Tax=Volvox carteri f. nagariensis TaxID=3068 RepID=D8TX99_VOLCA|nr:uncharacterized protein VOLCADRAFT_91514 [Volvox carteri f. nagariensis]EFJ47875.1 hypothetical protein VOLCADRAFT_91514 [Volvox carteri f. nagariensis]|eukprot:XP_002950981.1 hypothetical protein VOLCADRAFT_91514 [Volvox carteri f. nagariensis]